MEVSGDKDNGHFTKKEHDEQSKHHEGEKLKYTGNSMTPHKYYEHKNAETWHKEHSSKLSDKEHDESELSGGGEKKEGEKTYFNIKGDKLIPKDEKQASQYEDFYKNGYLHLKGEDLNLDFLKNKLRDDLKNPNWRLIRMNNKKRLIICSFYD